MFWQMNAYLKNIISGNLLYEKQQLKVLHK